MRTLSVVGARPQFVKLATVSRAMGDWSREHGAAIDDVILHTGQHYDPEMSDVFFDELQIPTPAINLDVGSGSHGAQTAMMLDGIEKELIAVDPDVVIVYGDTNSTLAAAIAAAKRTVPVAHVEAGLRSFNRAMPEEINRIVTDHISALLFAPTQTAIDNLRAENLSAATYFVGDVMLDALLFNKELALSRSDIVRQYGLNGRRYGVVTIHRAGNTDTERLGELLDALNKVARDIPLVFPMHPRTAAKAGQYCANWSPHENLRIVEPLGYLDFLQLFDSAAVVLTDSGGLQKEAFFVATPCVTLRDETEWPETLEDSANIVVGADERKIFDAVEASLARDDAWKRSALNNAFAAFGGGKAARLIVEELVNWNMRSRKDHG